MSTLYYYQNSPPTVWEKVPKSVLKFEAMEAVPLPSRSSIIPIGVPFIQNL